MFVSTRITKYIQLALSSMHSPRIRSLNYNILVSRYLKYISVSPRSGLSYFSGFMNSQFVHVCGINENLKCTNLKQYLL